MNYKDWLTKFGYKDNQESQADYQLFLKAIDDINNPKAAPSVVLEPVQIEKMQPEVEVKSKQEKEKWGITWGVVFGGLLRLGLFLIYITAAALTAGLVAAIFTSKRK